MDDFSISERCALSPYGLRRRHRRRLSTGRTRFQSYRTCQPPRQFFFADSCHFFFGLKRGFIKKKLHLVGDAANLKCLK